MTSHFYLDFVNVWRLLNRVSFSGKEVLSQSIEDVGTENHVLPDVTRTHVRVLDDGDVHVNDLELVWERNLEWRLEYVKKLGQTFERHVLRAVRIELLPDLVEEVVVFVSDALLDVFSGLRVVLQDHSDVHVDDDEEAEDEVHDHECDSGHVVATVARISGFRIRIFTVRFIGDGC